MIFSNDEHFCSSTCFILLHSLPVCLFPITEGSSEQAWENQPRNLCFAHRMVFPCGFHWFVDLFLERKGTLGKKLVLLLTLEGSCMSFCMNSVSGAGNDVFVCALSCLTLCDPMDCSLPGSSVHGIILARILSGMPCPPPGIFPLPNPGIKPAYPALQADSLMLSLWESSIVVPLQHS